VLTLLVLCTSTARIGSLSLWMSVSLFRPGLLRKVPFRFWAITAVLRLLAIIAHNKQTNDEPLTDCPKWTAGQVRAKQATCLAARTAPDRLFWVL